MTKDYKQLWLSYKQYLLEEIESICAKIEYTISITDEINKAPISNTMLETRLKQKLKLNKANGRKIVDVLMFIDGLDNTKAVAELSTIYRSGFEYLGIHDYNYNGVSNNKVENREITYKEKYDMLYEFIIKFYGERNTDENEGNIIKDFLNTTIKIHNSI